MSETLLFFTRHGSKDEKYKGIWAGQLDMDLSDKGRKQGYNLGVQLKESNFIPDVILCSTMIRGVNTAKKIVEGLNTSVEILAFDEFKEMTHGDVDGKTEEDFLKEYPWIVDAWKREEDVRFPNGENFEDVEIRALPKLKELLNLFVGKKILFVGHKSLNMVLIGYLLKIPYQYRYIPQQDVCKLSLFRISHEIKLQYLNINPSEINNYKLCNLE